MFKLLDMTVNDIEQKFDNQIKEEVLSRLNINRNETLSASEINAIVEAIKQKPTEPIWTGDPWEVYVSYRNQ